MPKILIIDPCLVNFRDERGGVHAEVGDMPTLDKEQCIVLAQMGRALFCAREDDPSKTKHYTAPAEMVKAAARQSPRPAEKTE